MKNYRNLEVWRAGHDLVLKIYKATNHFPSRELYGITSQIRRASVSIVANIAEGCGRGSDAEYARFLYISYGSTNEVEYLLILAKDLNYLKKENYDDLLLHIARVKQMLTKFIQKLKR